MHSSSASSEVNGGIIKFKNRRCYCGKKAGVRISESATNPYKLYFICFLGKCNYYSFWTPDNEEFNLYDDASSEQRENKLMQSGMQERNELKDLTTRVRNLESMQELMRIPIYVNMVFFAISIVVFLIAVMSIKIN